MKTTTLALTLATLALPTLALAQALQKETANASTPEGDLGKLQGNWKAMVGPEKNIPLVATVKGKEVTFRFTSPQGEEFTMNGEVKLDEKASPKTIDWVNFKTPDGQDSQPNLGLYKLEGDKLTVCNGGPGNPRPTELKQGEGGPPNLIELIREKTEKKD